MSGQTRSWKRWVRTDLPFLRLRDDYIIAEIRSFVRSIPQISTVLTAGAPGTIMVVAGPVEFKEVGKNAHPVQASTEEEDRVLCLIKVLI